MKRKSKGPQRYYAPELDMEIKVETTGQTNKYVAHYPTGPERINQSEMRSLKWEHRGEWNKREDGPSTIA